MKYIRILGELVVLCVTIWFIARSWVFPSFSDVGDVAFGLMLLYLIFFVVGTILYLAFRFLLLKLLSHKKLSRPTR